MHYSHMHRSFCKRRGRIKEEKDDGQGGAGSKRDQCKKGGKPEENRLRESGRRRRGIRREKNGGREKEKDRQKEKEERHKEKRDERQKE